MIRSLPVEVFNSYVLPDLLSEHLHQYLLFSKTPEWNPFYVLPLVSRNFQSECRWLCEKIFDLKKDEGGSVIRHILHTTKKFWDQANLPPTNAQPVEPCNYTCDQLMSSHSLIQAYLCTALAKCFFNFDVAWTIDLERQWRDGLLDDDEEEYAPDNVPELDEIGYVPRRFTMRDDYMHRVYLPLTCALKLCDRVCPDRVVYVLASHLSNVVPVYTSAPLMLKYSQDLDVYLTRGYRLNSTLVDWASQTLQLIADLRKMIIRMQRTSKLVKSFNPDSSVPMDVIRDTDIIAVLEAVAVADWGTERIRDSAKEIKRSLEGSSAEEED